MRVITLITLAALLVVSCATQPETPPEVTDPAFFVCIVCLERFDGATPIPPAREAREPSVEVNPVVPAAVVPPAVIPDQPGLVPTLYAVVFGSIDSEFLMAVRDQDVSRVATMLRNRQNVNVVDSLGNNAIFYAISNEDISMVRTLLQNGINLNARNNQGQIPLIYAVSRNNIPLIDTLINAGASVTARDNIREITPILVAVRQGNDTLVRHLLNRGANVNDRDADGNTLLHISINNNNLVIVRMLLERGADVFRSNNQGTRPLDLLRASTRQEFRDIAAGHE